MRSLYDPGRPGTVAASTMRGLLAATVLVGAVGLPPALLRGQGPAGGTVAGNVRLTTRVRGTPLPANAYQPRSVGRQAPGSLPEIRNVVVYLRGASARGPLPVATHEIRQEGEAFHPRVLAITRGSSVASPNADPYFHNVFSLSSAATLTPRVFVAARQEGASAPPLRTGLVVGSRSVMHATEATLGYRLNTDITFRGSFQSRKAYTRHAWDQQAGVSVVWAHRWW